MTRVEVLFAFLVLFQATNAQLFSTCKWTDPDTGAAFNIQPMYRYPAQGDYTGADDEYRYYMNLCGIVNIGGVCTDSNALLCQYKQGVYQAQIANFVNLPKPTWSLISKADPSQGVILTYNNGDICYGTERNRTAAIYLHCDPHATVTTTFSIYENASDPCTYYVSLTNPNACPVGATPTRINNGEIITTSTGASNWTYWTIDSQTTNTELQINTIQSSGNGWLELYVRFGALPTEQAYDSADLSSSSRHKVSLKRPGYSPGLQTGTYYIGVRAVAESGSIPYTIQPFLYDCINNCSGHGDCVYNPASGWNVCDCADGYETPAVDCSSQIIDISKGVVYNQVLTDDNVVYFRYQNNDPNAFQLFVDVTRDSTDAGTARPAIFIKNDGFPSFQDNDAFVQDRYGDANWELELTELDQGYYIVGVQGTYDTQFKFKIQLQIYDCPRGCSGFGTCNAATHVCTCGTDHGGSDCSEYTRALQYDQELLVYVAPDQVSYFFVNVTSAQARGHIDLLFTVVENNSNYYPRIVVSPFALGVPTIANHLYASPLPLRATSQIRVPASVLAEYDATIWYLGVVSYSYTAYEVTIKTSLEGYCPNDCSLQGVCTVNPNTYDAVCSCKDGWSGGACDVVNSSSSNDNVSVGLFVGLLFLFIFIGFVVGMGSSVLIKKCREPKESAIGAGRYNTMGD